VDLDEEYSKKLDLWILMKNIPGTQPMDLDEEYSRKPNLWMIWMKSIPGNPTCGTG